MAALPTEEWASSLDRMTAALDRALTDLDSYEAEWSPLNDAPAAATTPDVLLAWLERRLEQWDSRLTAAAELAESVQKQLSERETAIARWHDHFVRWHELIQREGVLTTPSSV